MNWNTFPWMILCALLLFMLAIRECRTEPVSPPSMDTLVISRIDTIQGISQVIVQKPTISIPPIVIPEFSPQGIDSLLRIYLSTNYYERILGDTSIQITLRDSIRGNSIVWTDSLRYKIRQRTNTVTIREEIPAPPGWFLGASIGLQGERIHLIPNLWRIDQRGRGMGIGYDPSSRMILISGAVRLGSRKK